MLQEENRTDRGNSVADTSRRLDVSTSTTRRLIALGELKAVRVSARRLIVMDSEIANYVTRKTVAA